MSSLKLSNCCIKIPTSSCYNTKLYSFTFELKWLHKRSTVVTANSAVTSITLKWFVWKVLWFGLWDHQMDHSCDPVLPPNNTVYAAVFVQKLFVFDDRIVQLYIFPHLKTILLTILTLCTCWQISAGSSAKNARTSAPTITITNGKRRRKNKAKKTKASKEKGRKILSHSTAAFSDGDTAVSLPSSPSFSRGKMRRSMRTHPNYIPHETLL